MLQAFIIVSREGLESFLIVAIILAYLRKTGQLRLIPAVHVGVVTAVILSFGLGYLLMSVANQALWEGILAVIAVVMVGSLVIHMWRVGPQFKHQMETKLARMSTQPSTKMAVVGVFLFTVLMITREGMETALMLFQVKQGAFILGSFLGLGAAIGIAVLWIKFSYLINLRRFFKVTGVFLLVFMLQIAVYAFHELCEAGIFAQSDYWHEVTEPYSPDGMYGKWFSFLSVAAVSLWLVGAMLTDWIKRNKSKVAIEAQV